MTVEMPPLTSGNEVKTSELPGVLKARGMLAAGIMEAMGVKFDARIQTFRHDRPNRSAVLNVWGTSMVSDYDDLVYPVYLSQQGQPVIVFPLDITYNGMFKITRLVRIWTYSELRLEPYRLHTEIDEGIARRLIDAFNELIIEHRPADKTD
ncbi:MAG: hypothetical protein JWM52_782 [Candidatus Saccharibacteria bacterium]|nr:hypothetical protein [Candidatus Saccharibacteria bacterium]